MSKKVSNTEIVFSSVETVPHRVGPGYTLPEKPQGSAMPALFLNALMAEFEDPKKTLRSLRP